jgi:hypothetical protein
MIQPSVYVHGTAVVVAGVEIADTETWFPPHAVVRRLV